MKLHTLGMEDMATRLRKFRQEKRLSQRELSRLTGIEQATLSRIERGEMQLLSPHANTISKILGIPVGRLLGIVSNITPAQVGSRRIPVLTYEQLGKLATPTSSNVEDEEDVDMHEFVVVESLHSADVFALRVQGDSMESIFPEGDVVIVDPLVDAKPGDFVVASTKSGDTLFRKYRDLGIDSHGNRIFELVPLNKYYPSLRSDHEAVTIRGVMVEQRRYRRT